MWREAGLDAKAEAASVKRAKELTKVRFLDGHKVEVAFDLEWNSKDRTFERDLYAMSAFSQCRVIAVSVLPTRSAALNPVFKEIGLMAKYGASTTWMGKLLCWLNAGRSGACPVLAIGIRPECIAEGEA